MAVLAGDVGGTKTVVALFENGPRGPESLAEATFEEAHRDRAPSLSGPGAVRSRD